MAAGIDPIYCKTMDVEWGNIGSATPVIGATANTSLVLASAVLGTDVWSVFTADATNGGFIQKLMVKPGVHNAATSNSAMRVFLNNGSTPSTLGNSVFIADIALPATTPSTTGATPTWEVPLNIAIPAGYRILVAFGAASANGYQVTAIGGHY